MQQPSHKYDATIANKNKNLLIYHMTHVWSHTSYKELYMTLETEKKKKKTQNTNLHKPMTTKQGLETLFQQRWILHKHYQATN